MFFLKDPISWFYKCQTSQNWIHFSSCSLPYCQVSKNIFGLRLSLYLYSACIQGLISFCPHIFTHHGMTHISRTKLIINSGKLSMILHLELVFPFLCLHSTVYNFVIEFIPVCQLMELFACFSIFFLHEKLKVFRLYGTYVISLCITIIT